VKHPASSRRASAQLPNLKILFARTLLLFLSALCIPASAISAHAQDTNSARHSPPPTAELIQGLQSPNPMHREHALRAAMWTRPLPLAVVPVLLDSFKKGGIYSGYMVRALTNAGPPAIPPLALALDDPDQAVKKAAVDALVRIVDESPASGPVLMRALGNKHDDVGYLVRALAKAGPQAIPQLILELNDPDEVVRKTAVDGLVRIAGASPATSPVLIDALGNTRDDVRGQIAVGFYGIGAPAVPLLRRSLSDPNPRICGGAAVALSYILSRYAPWPGSSAGSVPAATAPWPYWTGAPPSAAMDDLARALIDIDPDARAGVVNAITRLGPFAKAAIPAVLPMLNDPDPGRRMAAVNFLAAMGPAAIVAVPDLIRILRGPAPPQSADHGIRLKAIDVLGTLGPAAKDAVPDLASALKSTDSDASGHAAMALANIEPDNKEVLPILMPLLNQCCETGNAINALGDMRSNAQTAVPALEHLLATDDQASERQAAVTALVQIEGINALPTLVRVMSSDGDDSVRIATVAALGGLGSSSNRAISALVNAFSIDSDAVRQAAGDALTKLGSAAIPALTVALSSANLYQRAWSVQTLSRIKPLPDDAARALKLALRDQQVKEDPDVAQATDEGIASFVAGHTSPSTRRYSKADLSAPIPPDENHQYPAALKYLLPVVPSGTPAADANFLVTVHSTSDGDDLLAVWEKTGHDQEDQYERLMVDQAARPDASFDQPTVFSSRVLVTGHGADHYETALFVDLPLHRYWGDGQGVDDTVFVVDHDQLRPVQIQPADDWYAKKLRPGEWTWNSLYNIFANNDLKFGFLIWEKNQCHACAGGGNVSGTYQVVKELHYDAPNKAWVATWKMVVATAKRVPNSK